MVDNKRMCRFLLISIACLFLIVVSLSMVSAADPVFDPIRQWFTDWSEGKLSPNVAKFMFWILVSMVVYSIGSSIPGLNSIFQEGKQGLGILFSLIIGFLSMAYIAEEEVYALMISYSALGFVIGGALPFLILIVFTFKIASSGGSAAEKLANKALAYVMWGAFVFFMGYKIVASLSEGISKEINALQWILLFISLAIFLMLGYIFRKINKMATKEEVNAMRETIELSTERDRANRNAVKRAGEDYTRDFG